MKNKEFFYQQYDKINWENQEKTKINSFVYDFIIKNIISKHGGKNIRIFDIGFGIGFFFKALEKELKSFNHIYLEGCEPSDKNYKYFLNNVVLGDEISLRGYHKTFQKVSISKRVDFITSIYTFTAFDFEDLEQSVKKIYSMLKEEGKFILVVANEKYLEEKLKTKKDLFIEKSIIKYDGQKYEEILTIIIFLLL